MHTHEIEGDANIRRSMFRRTVSGMVGAVVRERNFRIALREMPENGVFGFHSTADVDGLSHRAMAHLRRVHFQAGFKVRFVNENVDVLTCLNEIVRLFAIATERDGPAVVVFQHQCVCLVDVFDQHRSHAVQSDRSKRVR